MNNHILIKTTDKKILKIMVDKQQLMSIFDKERQKKIITQQIIEHPEYNKTGRLWKGF